MADLRMPQRGLFTTDLSVSYPIGGDSALALSH
jgi:hypothetical protein